MSPALEALGWSLLHSLWQGLLVALLLAAVTPVLRRYRAEVAYAAACTALLVLAVLPVATWLMLTRELALDIPTALGDAWSSSSTPSVTSISWK